MPFIVRRQYQPFNPIVGGLTRRVLTGVVAVLATVVCLTAHSSEAHAKAGVFRVAVMEFDNASTDRAMDPLGKGLQSMLTTDLQQIGKFVLIERARLADIKAELKLGQTRAVDKKTAAKIGKLVGATHLVTGAFTVLGKKMRIDARMVAVETGKVLMTGQVSGTKEGFFEIQKDLVKRLVASTGVTTTAKERYKMGKVHTADFAAFVKFSQGLTFFDSKRFKKAVAAMRDASTIDGDFALAKLTQEHYERAVSKTRTKADAAKVAERELKVLKQDKQAALQANLIEWLFRVSESKSRKTSPQARMMSLNILYDIYAGRWGKTFSSRMEATMDNFALKRTSEALYADYYNKGRKLVGKVPPYINAMAYARPPKKADKAEFKAMMVKAADRLYAPRAVNSWSQSIKGFRGTALHMTMLEWAREKERLHKLAPKFSKAHCDVQHRKQPNCQVDAEIARLEELGDAFLMAADLATSTKYYMRVSAKQTDAAELDQIARKVKRNRDAAQALAGVPSNLQAYARSMMFTGRSPARDFHRVFKSGTLDRKVAGSMMSRHRWPSKRFYGGSYLLVGGVPTWAIWRQSSLTTGLRTDLRVTGEIHYSAKLPYPRKRPVRNPDPPSRSLLVYGPRNNKANFNVAFSADYKVPQIVSLARSDSTRTLWENASASARRARISFMFGLRDVDTPGVWASRGMPAIKPTPMTGWAVRLGGGQVAVVRITQVIDAEDKRGQVSYRARKWFTEVPVKTWRSRSVDKEQFAVRVKLVGTSLTVTVGGNTTTVSLPDARAGFTGFEFMGTGYAGLKKLSKK